MHAVPPDPTPAPVRRYSVTQHELLRDFASRYIWWKPVQEALLFPERILAQVMNLGTYADLGRLVTAFTLAEVRHVVLHAEPGWFNEHSWAFWHYRLGLATSDAPLPPLPTRTFPD